MYASCIASQWPSWTVLTSPCDNDHPLWLQFSWASPKRLASPVMRCYSRDDTLQLTYLPQSGSVCRYTVFCTVYHSVHNVHVEGGVGEIQPVTITSKTANYQVHMQI